MTTPECPKGPEREARPDLSQTVFEALWKTFEDEGGRLAPGTAERLTEAALKPISSELRRLTAEVALYRERDALTRFALQIQEDGPLQFLALRVRQQRDKALEEVSRLREQLAPAKLGAEVHQERADQLVIGLMRLLDKDREIENGPRASATSAASPLVHNVVLSSEEGAFGHWHVTCSCRESSEGDLAHAEFWKDQHLADTLVPVKSSNHQANQHDEGRPSGSTATPRSDEDEVQTSEFQVGDEVRWCWTGKNADGTWFNARLTEKHPHHYPKGWAGEVTDCGTAYTAEHMGEVPLGFKLFMDIPSLTLVSRPSPSLRKEGEDSD
jgi:hypothetical protein